MERFWKLCYAMNFIFTIYISRNSCYWWIVKRKWRGVLTRLKLVLASLWKFFSGKELSCAQTLKLDFLESLFHYHPLKEFLKKWVFEKRFGKSWNFGNFVSMILYLDCEGLESVEFNAHSFTSSPLNSSLSIHFEYQYPFKGKPFQILDFYDLFLELTRKRAFVISYYLRILILVLS